MSKELKIIVSEAELIKNKKPNKILFFWNPKMKKIMAKIKYDIKEVPDLFIVKKLEDLNKDELILGIQQQQKYLPVLSFLSSVKSL